MANKENGYNIANNGQQTVKAPKQQPKTTNPTVVRGTDLRRK